MTISLFFILQRFCSNSNLNCQKFKDSLFYFCNHSWSAFICSIAVHVFPFREQKRLTYRGQDSKWLGKYTCGYWMTKNDIDIGIVGPTSQNPLYSLNSLQFWTGCWCCFFYHWRIESMKLINETNSMTINNYFTLITNLVTYISLDSNCIIYLSLIPAEELQRGFIWLLCFFSFFKYFALVLKGLLFIFLA